MRDQDDDRDGAANDGMETVEIIARALLEKFGENALMVVRSQAADPLNETSHIWLQISKSMSGR